MCTPYFTNLNNNTSVKKRYYSLFIYIHSKREQKKSSPVICLRYSELLWDLSSGSVCLGLILLALYQVPHSVNILSSAPRARMSTTGYSFNGPIVRNCFWKSSTPVFKGGIASDPSNYRPISLTSVFSKLMERVVVLDMLRHCKEQGLISKQQHGFLARKSTVTNMLSCMNDWTCAQMNRSSVAVAYIDFQKAFDSVCHAKLFCKLESIGFTGNLLQWLVNFLLIDGNVLVSVIVRQTPPELLAVPSREVALALYCFCYTLIVLPVYLPMMLSYIQWLTLLLIAQVYRRV